MLFWFYIVFWRYFNLILKHMNKTKSYIVEINTMQNTANTLRSYQMPLIKVTVIYMA